jgi:hypothetical protein
VGNPQNAPHRSSDLHQNAVRSGKGLYPLKYVLPMLLSFLPGAQRLDKSGEPAMLVR